MIRAFTSIFLYYKGNLFLRDIVSIELQSFIYQYPIIWSMVRSIKKEILNKKSLKQNKYEGKLYMLLCH